MALDTYTKVNYVNNTKPNVSAGNLNHMDQAISDNRDAIITLQSGGGTGGGHTIQDASGTDMAQETKLQFTGTGVTSVTDDSTNGKTVVTISGEKGDAATVDVGTVTTGAAGSSAAVTNSGSSSAAILNFTIPQGADGSNGTNGTSVTVKSATKTGKVTTVILTDSAGDHTITIDDGADGSGTGDMLKSVYDTNNDGIVDHAALADTATTATSATSAATSETCTGNAATATTATTATNATTADGYTTDGAIATKFTEQALKSKTAVSIAVANIASDTTYTEFPYRSTLQSWSGITSNYIPDASVEADNAYTAGCMIETTTNGWYAYFAEMPTAAVVFSYVAMKLAEVIA